MKILIIKLRLKLEQKAAIEINNPIGYKIEIDKDLISLLGIRERIQTKNYINCLNGFNKYLVRCDILSSQENLLSGKPTDILACFDIKGKPQERVVYKDEEPIWRKIESENIISSHSIKLTVTDEENHVINFNGPPMIFQIEIE